MRNATTTQGEIDRAQWNVILTTITPTAGTPATLQVMEFETGARSPRTNRTFDGISSDVNDGESAV